jgi:2,4'-dihydroxyacetophenone dioxygenase
MRARKGESMNAPSHFASRAVDTGSIPWISLGPGESFKPLHFFPKDRGRILLLRLDPGIVVPRHRHGGEVHAFNLAGSRKLIESGEVIGPGGYVYEPAGNVDSWMAVGIEPVVVHIAAYGAMEYLGDRDEVLRRDTPSSLLEIYRCYCEENGIPSADLVGLTAEGK